MDRLASGLVSVDATIIVDFHLAGRLALLGEVFRGRLLISDIVAQELLEADLHLFGARTVTLSSTGEWDFLGKVRRHKSGLGIGEVSAITVAYFHAATLLTNDRQARQAAEEFKLPVCGGLEMMQYTTAIGLRVGPAAVMLSVEMR